jgi:hypothetical protein
MNQLLITRKRKETKKRVRYYGLNSQMQHFPSIGDDEFHTGCEAFCQTALKASLKISSPQVASSSGILSIKKEYSIDTANGFDREASVNAQQDNGELDDDEDQEVCVMTILSSRCKLKSQRSSTGPHDCFKDPQSLSSSLFCDHRRTRFQSSGSRSIVSHLESPLELRLSINILSPKVLVQCLARLASWEA